MNSNSHSLTRSTLTILSACAMLSFGAASIASASQGAGAAKPSAPQKTTDAAKTTDTPKPGGPPITDSLEAPASTPLDRFKAMVGDWNADLDGDGTSDAVVTYRLIANKSTVVETMFAGSDHEMITVFTMDGPDLVLTHYCALGNQPHLKATSIKPEAIAFEFVKGGNMKSRDEAHMDAVTFVFEGPDRVTSKWSGYENGKSEEHVSFVMTRAPKTAG